MNYKNEGQLIVKSSRAGENLEIAVYPSGVHEYTISVPLNYNFEIIPLDNTNKSVPISMVRNIGPWTIVEMPGTPGMEEKWKVRVKEPQVKANVDPTGSTQPPAGEENGDGFVDWLCQQASSKDQEIWKKLDNTRRKIVFRYHYGNE